jgi:hypothetical protein
MKRFEETGLATRLAICALASGLAVGSACAGDAQAPAEPMNTANRNHCSALGEGFFPVNGSDACIRISGYVAAGTDFGGGLRPAHAPAPFDAATTSALHTYTGVSVDAQFDTPMGPGVIHVDGGRRDFGP